MKVRAYLALTATAVLVPVIIFSTVALKMLLDAERKAALRGVQETARATALIVDRELANAETALRVLGSSYHLATGNLRDFYEQAGIANTSTETWIVLFDREGQQLVNTRVPFGTPLPRRGYPEYGLEVMKTQKLRVSNLVKGPLVGRSIIVIDAPVALGGGQRYVLGQAFLPEYFNRAFAHPGVPSSWVIGIFDREGLTIARNRRMAEFVGKPAVPDLVQAARAATEGVLRTKSLDGVDIYGVFTHTALSGWTVAIGVPADDIEALARRTVTVAGLGLLAAVVFAAAAALLLGRRLARSIAGAAESAAMLGRGGMPASVDTGVAELVELHAALTEAGEILSREKASRALVETERTRLLASEQEARQLAESQNKAKDDFLAMLGHELRNPLNAISGAISVMEANGAGAQNIARARAIIRRQSEHLGRIVDDLLDLSRLTTGKVFLDKQTVDLAEAVKVCIEALRTAGRTEGYTLNLRAEPVSVLADPTRLEQIISNLLTNAFKYTPPGGRIDVDVRAEGDQAVLVVRDSGVGIPSELLPRVFDIFVQGADLLDRRQGGLGIGLALVRRLTTLHGGRVTAESVGTGAGSMFTVRLPRTTDVAAKPPAAVSAPAEKRCRILIIEDNQDGRHMLSMMLTLNGYQVFEAGNGMDGLRIAALEKPEVAVVDIGLPGVDGYEVARRLKADPATRGIGLIALTGYGQEADRRRALDAGFDVHLVKPFDSGRLIKAIGACLSDS